MGLMHVVFGANGPTGLALVRQLHGAKKPVRAVSRRGNAAVPGGVENVSGDAREAVRYCADAEVVYCCIGVNYTYANWGKLWPPIIDGLIAGSAGSRLVFADNLYAYGPVDGPLTEDLPGTTYGEKPALRARMATELLGSGAALVRASDFYGPGVRAAMLGERVFPMALAGKAAQVAGDIDQPHSYTYVPDYARAMATVGESEAAMGQVWNVPNAPTVSTRELIEMTYALAGTDAKIAVLPRWLMSVLGVFMSGMRGMKEMMYQWERPHVVNHSKFAGAFWGDATPFSEGLKDTLNWYRLQTRDK